MSQMERIEVFGEDIIKLVCDRNVLEFYHVVFNHIFYKVMSDMLRS